MPGSPLLKYLSKLATFLRLGGHEFGLAGMEIAIAGCIAAATLGGTVMTMGDQMSEQVNMLVHSSVDRVSATLYVRGSVIATAAGTPLTANDMRFTLGLTGVSRPVDLQAGDALIISYRDLTTQIAAVPFRLKELSGNGDGLLSPGEAMQVTIDVDALRASTGATVFAPGGRWTLELSATFGGSLTVSREMPLYFDPVMDLH